MKYESEIIKLRNSGYTYKDIAKKIGCSLGTVAYHCNPNEKKKSSERRKRYKNGETKKHELKKYYCKRCNEFIGQGWNNVKAKKLCENCNKNIIDWSKITKKEFRNSFSNIHQYHARLRQLSRSAIKLQPCKICGYKNFIDVCHIKPVASFDDNATIAEINSEDNLICLCPNHHKEFDNNLIQITVNGIEPKLPNL